MIWILLILRPCMHVGDSPKISQSAQVRARNGILYYYCGRIFSSFGVMWANLRSLVFFALAELPGVSKNVLFRRINGHVVIDSKPGPAAWSQSRKQPDLKTMCNAACTATLNKYYQLLAGVASDSFAYLAFDTKKNQLVRRNMTKEEKAKASKC